MARLNFPDNPSLNDIYSAKGRKWQWNGHAWRTYAGLDVKVWLTDSDGVDVMLAELPDSTTVSTIANGSKNSVQVLTKTEYNSVWIPYSAAATLYDEAETAEDAGDMDTAAIKISAGDAKMDEATTAIRAL